MTIEPSNGLQRLLARAKMVESDLPRNVRACQDELAALATELHDIKQELDLYEQGEVSRPVGWKLRAVGALKYKQAAFNAIKQHQSALKEVQNAARAPSAVENVRADLTRAIQARDEKIRSLRHVKQRADTSLMLAKKWVKENYPDRIEELYAVLSASESAFDARPLRTAEYEEDRSSADDQN